MVWVELKADDGHQLQAREARPADKPRGVAGERIQHFLRTHLC